MALSKMKGGVKIEQESIIEQKCMQLLQKANDFQASDIHLLPTMTDYQLLFRKYGYFEKVEVIPQDFASRMISYFKFLSSLDISEKRKPQSGSFQKTLRDIHYAFRISTLPSSLQKESLAIRILRQNYTLQMNELCHFQESANQLAQLATEESGLIVISGITGSGKTTTLYSLLHYCTQQLSRHVISLEDPVESTQEALLQIQVNERAGITYATGLKAILRHSPEVIMIGEIRDKETAKIAIEAALSGHLVISTIHAKDTMSCLYRLQDLSISIEELRQMLRAVISQSLVQTTANNYKALFEILQKKQLRAAIVAIQKREHYELPHHETLQGQKQKLLGDPYEYFSQ